MDQALFHQYLAFSLISKEECRPKIPVTFFTGAIFMLRLIAIVGLVVLGFQYHF